METPRAGTGRPHRVDCGGLAGEGHEKSSMYVGGDGATGIPNLLFRWFVGLSADEPVRHPTVFTKNRDRLLEGPVAEEFFSLIVRRARSWKPLSAEHVTVISYFPTAGGA